MKGGRKEWGGGIEKDLINKCDIMLNLGDGFTKFIIILVSTSVHGRNVS